MRIAVVCEFPTLLGGERSLLAIEPLLHAFGCELLWLAPETGLFADELRSRDCRLLPFSIRDEHGRLLPSAAVLQRLAEVVQRESPAVLHANSLAMSRRLGSLAASWPIPTTGHIRDIVGLSQAAVKDLNRNHRLIAVSQATRDFHVSQGVDAAKIEVVYNGIDVAEFAALCRSDIRRELGLPADAFLIATIGQIGLRKAQTVLAEAAVLVDRQLPALSRDSRPLHYLLIGERYSDKDESREFDAQITATIAQAGLQTSFHRLGYRSDVPALLRAVDVVVHPARQEPLGRVLLEAAAAGRAIVATNVGGTCEILTHEASALLMPPDDPQRLAHDIIRLWSDDSLRLRLGTAARDIVRSRFTPAACAAGCLQVWNEVLRSAS